MPLMDITPQHWESIPKVDTIVATLTQLVKVLQNKIPPNTKLTEKDQQTKLSIFNIVAKMIWKTDAEKQSIASSQYTI